MQKTTTLSLILLLIHIWCKAVKHLSSWSKYSQVMFGGSQTSSSHITATILTPSLINLFLIQSSGPCFEAIGDWIVWRTGFLFHVFWFHQQQTQVARENNGEAYLPSYNCLISHQSKHLQQQPKVCGVVELLWTLILEYIQSYMNLVMFWLLQQTMCVSRRSIWRTKRFL